MLSQQVAVTACEIVAEEKLCEIQKEKGKNDIETIPNAASGSTEYM